MIKKHDRCCCYNIFFCFFVVVMFFLIRFISSRRFYRTHSLTKMITSKHGLKCIESNCFYLIYFWKPFLKRESRTGCSFLYDPKQKHKFSMMPFDIQAKSHTVDWSRILVNWCKWLKMVNVKLSTIKIKFLHLEVTKDFIEYEFCLTL